MKRTISFLLIFFLLVGSLSGCNAPAAQVVATTLPVYEFTAAICAGSGISVGLLVTEDVSCLHDYTLQVSQMRMIEGAQVVVISGAGLEDFLDDALSSAQTVVDSSAGCHIHDLGHDHGDHDHAEHGHHHHDTDPHIWLSPENAKTMAQNICDSLSSMYPEHASLMASNNAQLQQQLDTLQVYGEQTLSDLNSRQLITFHDGFGYFAESFDLTILETIEEESGSEASARELTELIDLIGQHNVTAVFTEENASTAAAQIICAEIGIRRYTLSMAMSGDSYFDAMYHNIDTIKEALG